MEQLNRLNASFEYKVVTKDEDYSIQLQTKAHIIDPAVYTNHKKVLASTLSKYIYKKKHEAHEMSNSGICLSLLE